MKERSKIDLVQLTKEIRSMNSRKKLYQVLKNELTKLGHWRDRPRGNPAKGWAAMKDKINAKNS